jgi:predicted nucleic acid-binding protein
VIALAKNKVSDQSNLEPSEQKPPAVEHAVLDTCVVIEFPAYAQRGLLPQVSSVTAITFAELTYGIALAPTPLEAVRRSQVYADLTSWYDPLPFDREAAEKYGELTALVLATGRSPRPRRLDLMIAAIAAANELPLMTANPDDYRGLESILDIIEVQPQPNP